MIVSNDNDNVITRRKSAHSGAQFLPKNKAKIQSNDTHTQCLVFQISQKYPGIFDDVDYTLAALVQEIPTAISAMDELVAFTPTNIANRAAVSRRKVAQLCLQLELELFLSSKVVNNGLSGANIYWIRDHPKSQIRVEILEKKYAQWNQVEKTSARRMKEKMKTIWKEQSDAAAELRREKEQEEKDLLLQAGLYVECKCGTMYPKNQRCPTCYFRR